MLRSVGWILVAILATPLVTRAQPPSPPPPARYQVTLRYRLPVARSLHVMGYDRLVADLEKLGFTFDPPLEDRPDSDREDTAKNYLKGTIASSQVAGLLAQTSIANLLLVPEDFKLPEAADGPVRVSLELGGRLLGDEQRELADQVRLLLDLLSFREATGYDHHGRSGRPFTRLVGQVPASSLELLLKDLRFQPAGWFDSKFILEKLPTPLRDVNPVHLVEVLPDAEPLEVVKDASPREPAFLEKISPDLWDLMQAKKDDVVRVQVVYSGEPILDDVRRELRHTATTFQIEGQLGNVVTGLVSADQIGAVAALKEVSTIRRPRVTPPDIAPGVKREVKLKTALEQTGLDEFHRAGHRGKGVRIAILDRDFRQWRQFIETRKLRPTTRLVDLTAERSPAIVPMPEAAGDNPGHGTLAAVAAAQAAPEADIVLVRLDVHAPAQLTEVIGYLKGERLSESLVRRFDEIQRSRSELNVRRQLLSVERLKLLQKFPDDRELEIEDAYAFLGPAFGWLFSEREYHRLKMIHQERLEKDHAEREERYRSLLEAVRSLQGIDLLVSPYVWNDGFPLGGSSPLTRWFNARSLAGTRLQADLLSPGLADPLVFQSAGNTRGQTWTALARDIDRNGALEFATPEEPLPRGRWTRELNFLGWRPYGGTAAAEIPKDTKLRLSLQWREPHEPEYYELGPGDPYRSPLLQIRVVLLRQRDPATKVLAGDTFQVVARTSGVPQRLQHLPGGAVYEHVLEVPLESDGVYAVRIERQLDYAWSLENLDSELVRPTFARVQGLTATGLRPVGAPTLPFVEKKWEFRPRLYVEAVETDKRLDGRPVLADFATEQGTLAVPGDSRGLFTITSIDAKSQTRPYAVMGTPAYVDLAQQHLIYVPDEVGVATGPAFGTSVSTAFAAGAAAALLSSGQSRAEVEAFFRSQQGYALRLARRESTASETPSKGQGGSRK